MSFRTCIHVKTNGIQCQSPALRKSTHCYFHHQHRRMLKRDAILARLDNSKDRLNSLNKLLHAALAGRIDPEVARTLIYGIQTGQRL